MRLSLLFLSCASFLLAWQSPADPRIAAARQQMAANPKAFQTYNELAAGLCRKARDTSDITLYDQANDAVDRSLALSPGNYDAMKLRVTVLLGKHEFQQALKLAQELNHKVPDDIGNWASLADANAALGNYSEAERDAQWVLDLRRGSALGFEKAAGLRELFGDNEGAIEFYGEALSRTAQSDLDQRAWLLTQKARVTLASGNPKSASDTLAEALHLFPASQLAALVSADVQSANGNPTEAASLFEKCYHAVPSSVNLYKWATALDQAGQKEKADEQFAAFEKKARAEVSQPYNANLELIAYYTDRKTNPAEALRIATLESAKRQDCHTLAALAWALYQNGKFGDAKTEMDKALAVGIREATYLCHAALISAKVNNTSQPRSCTSDRPMQASLGDSK
jgi:tetratricopeptide (TPR) repeat protein